MNPLNSHYSFYIKWIKCLCKSITIYTRHPVLTQENETLQGLTFFMGTDASHFWTNIKYNFTIINFSNMDLEFMKMYLKKILSLDRIFLISDCISDNTFYLYSGVVHTCVPRLIDFYTKIHFINQLFGKITQKY